jgi:hypothetical protein
MSDKPLTKKLAELYSLIEGIEVAMMRAKARRWLADLALNRNATIPTDREMIRELYKPDWTAWFGDESGAPDDAASGKTFRIRTMVQGPGGMGTPVTSVDEAVRRCVTAFLEVGIAAVRPESVVRPVLVESGRVRLADPYAAMISSP